MGRSSAFLAILLSILLNGCQVGGGGGGGTPQPIPDFSIAVTPGTVNAAPGGASNPASVSVMGLNGFSGQAIVSVTGLPQGATVSPSQQFPVTAGASQQITITVPQGAAPGNVALTLTAVSGQLNHSAALVLSVGGQNPDFAMSVTPGAVSAMVGQTSNAATVAISALNGFAGAVSVSVTGLPAGVTTSPMLPVPVNAGASQMITFSVPASAAPGSVALTVRGAAGSLVHTQPLRLDISAGPVASDQVVVAGATQSTNFFTTPGAHRPNAMGGSDGTLSSVRISGGVATHTFSTLFGGSGGEEIRDSFVDGLGNIYVTGHTTSADMPTTTDAFDRTYNNNDDAFVAKFSAAGTLLASTFLGGGQQDEGYNIFVDGAGFIYVGGRTRSSDFPVTASAFDRSHNSPNLSAPEGYDMFLVKLLPDLTDIVWSTFIGGDHTDTGRGRLVVDGAGNVIMGGWTKSSNFPQAAGVRQGARDSVVVKVSADGSTLLFSRLIPGNETDIEDGATGGLALAPNGDIVVCGGTSSPNLPGALNSFGGGAVDAYIARLTFDGTISALRYYGGNGTDDCQGLAIDSSGNVVIAVMTNSTSGLPPRSQNAFQPNKSGGLDWAFARFSANLQQLQASTYVGHTGNEDGDTLRIELDAAGNIFFCGHSSSSGIPWITANALDSTYNGGSFDYVVLVLTADMQQVLFATYLGGNNTDVPRTMRYRRN